LPAEVLLTSRGARRVAREGVLQSFDQAALALNEDWGTHLDGKQVERWSQAIGRAVRVRRDAEVAAYAQGIRPAAPRNPAPLLVIGMDGGRVQTRQKQGENGSRWREDNRYGFLRRGADAISLLDEAPRRRIGGGGSGSCRRICFSGE
jgi:hypothetical protein